MKHTMSRYIYLLSAILFTILSTESFGQNNKNIKTESVVSDDVRSDMKISVRVLFLCIRAQITQLAPSGEGAELLSKVAVRECRKELSSFLESVSKDSVVNSGVSKEVAYSNEYREENINMVMEEAKLFAVQIKAKLAN